MGANAQIAVPAFTAGQVLTAAQQTQINTGIPVFATTTTRDAAFGGTGEKVLAQGQYAYIEATSTLMVYSGSAWINAISSGLNLITAQTIGSAVSSVTVTNAFSATYDSYKITVTGGVSSIANSGLTMRLGASATAYNNAFVYSAWNNTASAAGGATQAQFDYAGIADTNGLNANMELNNPFLAKYTFIQAQDSSINLGGMSVCTHKVATSYTDFTLTVTAGTITGGTVRVYGYANS
jgi:hypothetical protein